MQHVLDYLGENEPRFVRELCDYLHFPSVSAQSHHRSEVEAAARWLVDHCQSIGLGARLCPTDGNPVVVAQAPRNTSASSRRRLHFLVYGHYDVQPAEPLDLWKSPPFEPRIEGRSLFDARLKRRRFPKIRSEEHTSELQSQSNIVCRP